MVKEPQTSFRERVDFSKITDGLPYARPSGHPDPVLHRVPPDGAPARGAQGHRPPGRAQGCLPHLRFQGNDGAGVPRATRSGRGSASAAGSRGSRTPGPSATPARRSCPRAMELSEKEVCPFCGAARKIELPLCEHCGDRVGLRIKYTPMECIQKGYTYSIPLKLKVQLVSWEKDADDQGQAAQAHQAAGSLFRRHPAHDREGDVHLQRHRAGRRQPAPALAGRVFPPGGGQGLLHRQDHPVPRRLGRVRARREEPPLGPPRPQEEIPGHRVPPGPRLRQRRGDPQALP